MDDADDITAATLEEMVRDFEAKNGPLPEERRRSFDILRNQMAASEALRERADNQEVPSPDELRASLKAGREMAALMWSSKQSQMPAELAKFLLDGVKSLEDSLDSPQRLEETLLRLREAAEKYRHFIGEPSKSSE